MSIAYDKFVHRKNLEKFKKQLDAATDEDERKMLRRLLAEEEAKAQVADEK